jgi:hypothetical protein
LISLDEELNLNSLDEFLGFKGENSEQQLFTMIYTNALESQNSKRSENVKNGTHVNCFDEKVTSSFVPDLLRSKLSNDMKTFEKNEIEKLKDGNQSETFKQILMAPDVFVTSILIQTNQMFMGKGEFQKMLEFVISSGNSFGDLAKKLALLKSGSLQSEDSTKTKKIFSDKSYKYIVNSINYKYVFRIWSNHICNKIEPCISLQELKDFFPEYSHRLDMYDNCCDKTGKIVKNKQFYEEYFQKGHKHGKRGGAKVRAPAQPQVKA